MKRGAELNKTGRAMVVTSLFVACVLFIMLVMFGASNLGIISSGFTIRLKNENDDSAYLSLSQSEDFEVKQSTIVCKTPKYMSNITGYSLSDELDGEGGEHNGKDYIAFTFFIRNTGTIPCNITESMTVDADVKGAVDAVRIRIYRNGERTDYAKPTVNGEKEEHFCDKSFASETEVFNIKTDTFKVGDTIKYTVVIWLEGDDPECLDKIRGGMVKLSMNFSVVGDE